MAVDPQLEKIITSIVTAEGLIGPGIFGAGQRPWFNFADVQKVGKFDYAGIHALFTRDSSNDTYAKARQSATTTSKEIQTAKLSADYLAGMERDYRMRTRSRVRMFVHGGNRAVANGSAKGPVKVNSIDWLSRMLAESSK